MELIGGLAVLVAFILGLAAVNWWARANPADTRRDDMTGISEREWSDAIR